MNISVPRDATLTISYVGGDVKVENLNGEIEITFVGGDAILRNLTGHVTVGSSIGGELQMENVSKISMNAGRGMPASDISEKIQRKVEAATRRADKKIRDAEHKMRRAEFIAVERKFRHGIPPIPPLPPIPPIPSIPPLPPMGRGASRRRVVNMNFSGAPEASQSVSDEERMTILKMLQEKKITSEEADKLLAALEGGS